MRKIVFLLLILTLFPAITRSQPLIDRVPDNALVYIGWQGTDALGLAYEGSKFKKFIDASTFKELMSKSLPAALQKLADEEPDNAANVQASEQLARIYMKRPIAVYLGGMRAADRMADHAPAIRAGLICDAGPEKDALLAAVNQLVGQIKDDEIPLRVVSEGNLVAVVAGYDDKAAPLAAGKSLNKTPAFTAATKHFPPDSALSFYIDVEGGVARLEENLKAGADEEFLAAWGRALDASGIKGLKRLVMSAGFVKDEWQSRTFIDAPAPRTGLMKLLEPAPIDPALLGRIPADSTSAAVAHFDFAVLIATIREIAAAVDPEAGAMMQKGLGAASMAIGRRIEDELLAPLGSQWAIFASPGYGGKGALGLVGANKLDDSKLAKAAWADLYFALSNMIPNLATRNGVQVTPTADDKALPGTMVYSFKVSSFPAVPCFTVHDGFIYFGADPAVLVKAATAPRQPSLIETPAIAALLKSIEAPAGFTGFGFGDLAATAGETVRDIEEMWPTLVAGAKQEGIELPDRLLPKIEDLKPLLGPSLSVSWADQTGLHGRSRLPFPAATAFGYAQVDEMTVVGAAALGVGIALPSLNKARETANRIKCQSNLSQIGKGMLLYSNENKGAAPPDLGALILTQDMTADAFVCPSGDNSVPAGLLGKAAAEQAKWVNENADFVYVKPTEKIMNWGADMALVYEKIGHHDQDGINILFRDGHTEFLRMDQALETLKAAGVAEPVNQKTTKGG